jgi:hypothetical protein
MKLLVSRRGGKRLAISQGTRLLVTLYKTQKPSKTSGILLVSVTPLANVWLNIIKTWEENKWRVSTAKGVNSLIV